MALLKNLKHYGYKLHKSLVYLGALAIFVYALSGIMHPIMAWFGAKQIQFRPPVIEKVSSQGTENIANILQRNALKKVALVKIVPSLNQQTILQVTKDFNQPRRYFDVSSQKELLNYDAQQAQFIGEYYTGLPKDTIRTTEFITKFNAEYPAVNKLLPVYKITYNTPDNIVAYVDTEISQLASLNNDFQRNVQNFFQTFHTLSFLDGYEFLRVCVAMTLLLSLLSVLITGVILLYGMQKRKITDPKRKIHRILAHILWIPLFFFIISGMYHLLHYAFEQPDKNHRFIKNFEIKQALTKPKEVLENINDLTLISYQDKIYYRISVANEKLSVDEHAHHDLKNKKFDGLSREQSAIYINAHTGKQETITDTQIVRHYAQSYNKAPIKDIEKISFFGMGYDFRNKRLPVYKISYDTPNQDILFIDPATGLLVDASYKNRAFENFIFSFFHKWNFALMLTTREIRDSIIVGILISIITLTLLGLSMKLKTFKNRRV